MALSLLALCWGFINFGVLLWLPAELVANGAKLAEASGLIAKSALLAVPTVIAVAVLYSRWSTRLSLVAVTMVTIAGLVGVIALRANPTPDRLSLAALIDVPLPQPRDQIGTKEHPEFLRLRRELYHYLGHH